MTTLNTKKHIDEIDGLRGIAVLLVVIYHAYPSILPGGFIGVDIFFVISGFVISRTYLQPLITCETSLKEFYVSRLRRLTPALLLVFAASSIAAFFLAPPDRIISFAWSLLAQLVYLQNLVFWIEGDYFSGALSKPLLHTWSLAIEEQFYIFWALLIIGFRKIPKSVLPVVIVLAMLSLVAGFILEGRSPKTVFFLLPFRIWEFSIGILIYLLIRNRPISTSPRSYPTTVDVIALMTIAATGVLFNEDSQFPGPQSIIACFATAALILTAATNQQSSRLLTLKSLKYLGKISYSLYLWHWPPIVFYYLAVGEAPSFWPATLLLTAAVAGAIASFHLVEQPIRRKVLFSSTSSLFWMIGLTAFATFSIGIAMIHSKGLLFRYPAQIQPFFAASQERGGFRCGQWFVLNNPSAEFCKLTKSAASDTKAVLILGDSHADVLKELLAEIADSANIPLYLTVRNCDLGWYGSLSFCSNDIFEKIIKQARRDGITDVLAISYWEAENFSATSLTHDIQKLVGSGIRVHVVSTVPNDESYDPRTRAKSALNGMRLNFSGISREKHESNASAEKKIFDEAIQRDDTNVKFVDPAPFFCSTGECKWHKDGIPYYLDSNHLTFTGGEVLRPVFTDMMFSIKNHR